MIGASEADLRATRDREAHQQRLAEFHALVRAAVADALETVIARIKSCPQCDRPFLKRGKMMYCSEPCQNKAGWTRFKTRKRQADV